MLDMMMIWLYEVIVLMALRLYPVICLKMVKESASGKREGFAEKSYTYMRRRREPHVSI